MRDIFTVISNAQSLVGLTSVVSTSSIPIISSGAATGPLSIAGRDVGRGKKIFFRCCVTTAFDAGVASLGIEPIMATDAALTAGIVVLPRTVVLLSGLTLGNEFDVVISSLSENNVVGKAFLGLRYLPSSAPATGAITAGLSYGDSPGKAARLLRNYVGPQE